MRHILMNAHVKQRRGMAGSAFFWLQVEAILNGEHNVARDGVGVGDGAA